MPATLLLTVALTLHAQVPRPLEAAVQSAVPTGTRAVLSDYRPRLERTCVVEVAELQKPPRMSGTVAVHLSGHDERRAPCAGWGWVSLKLYAPGWATLRPVRAGEPLEGAVGALERELRVEASGLTALPEGAVAARALVVGTWLEPSHLRAPGPVPGSPVTVVIKTGALVITQQGRALSCARGRACALLATGKRVEGRLADGRLILELP